MKVARALLMSLLIIMSFVKVARTDEGQAELFLEGSLQIEYAGLAHIEEKVQGRDLVGQALVELTFVTTDHSQIRLARIPIEVRMPVFGYREISKSWSQQRQDEVAKENAHAIKGAKLGIISSLVRFEDAAFPMEALPEGFKVSGYNPVQPLGGRASQFMEKLYEKIKTQSYKRTEGGESFGDFEEEAKSETNPKPGDKAANSKEVQIRNGVSLNIAFDSKSKVRNVEVLAPEIDIQIELPLPEAIRAAQELVRSDLSGVTLEKLVKIQQAVARTTQNLGKHRYEVQRISLIAEEVALKLDFFREANLVEYHLDRENVEAGIAPASAPSYWKNEARLKELKKIAERFQTIRDYGVKLACERKLVNQ